MRAKIVRVIIYTHTDFIPFIYIVHSYSHGNKKEGSKVYKKDFEEKGEEDKEAKVVSQKNTGAGWCFLISN